jgi:hypothetical protein
MPDLLSVYDRACVDFSINKLASSLAYCIVHELALILCAERGSVHSSTLHFTFDPLANVSSGICIAHCPYSMRLFVEQFSFVGVCVSPGLFALPFYQNRV